MRAGCARVDVPVPAVIVVDDNDINRRVLQRQLEMAVLAGAPLEIHTAVNGQEALDLVLASEPPFELVFMDIEMPVMDGLQATARIREHERARRLPPVAIVGLSGNARQVRPACVVVVVVAGGGTGVQGPPRPAVLTGGRARPFFCVSLVPSSPAPTGAH